MRPYVSSAPTNVSQSVANVTIIRIEPMDVARIRFMTEQALGAFETLDRDDATYHAMLGLSDILLYVADDPVAIDLVRRIEALIDRECGGTKPNTADLGNGEHTPLVTL